MSLIRRSFSFAGHELSIHSIVDNEGTTWMLANPFAKILGYKEPRKAVTKHVGENNMSDMARLIPDIFAGGPGSSLHKFSKFINKRGLLELIMRSKMTNAVDFQMWVTGEVLPSLEETGNYSMQQAPSQQQAQLSAIHQVVEGVPATWYEEKMTLMERERQLLERNECLHREKEALYEKMLGMRADVAKKPSDEAMHHVLCVYYVGIRDNEYVYRGVRRQKRYLPRSQPNNEELIYMTETPNAISAFNRAKDHIGPHRSSSNMLYCSKPPDEVARLLAME